jgi:hypothetical protein
MHLQHADRPDPSGIHRRLTRAGAGLLLCFAWGAVAFAPATLISPDNRAEPALHFSFVNDAGIPGVRGPRVAAVDFQYAADVAAQMGQHYSMVDIQMQQCYSGGFLNDIRAQIANPHTFASAANYYEPAWNKDGVGPPPPQWLDNWTRSWRDHAGTFNGSGMLAHYQTTLNGSPGGGGFPIPKDPFYPASEHPQYESPDPAMGGVNDSREIGNAPRQYVVMVAWDEPDARHGVNIARMYETMRTTYGIPAARIAVLYNNNAALPNLGPYAGILPSDPGGLGPVPVDATVTRANWLNAINGGYFGADPPQPGDNLLIYNTGHGDHIDLGQRFRRIFGLPNEPRYEVPKYEGFFTGITGDPTIDSSVTNIGADPNDPGQYWDSLQLVFEDPVESGVMLTINGVEIGSLATFLRPYYDDSVNNFEPFITDHDLRTHYVIDGVPHWLLDTDPLNTTIGFRGLPDATELGLLAVYFQGGDQGWLVVPEPAGLWLVVIGAPLYFRRRT